MAADRLGFNIPYEALGVRCAAHPETFIAADPNTKLMGPVAVWNPGVTDPAWGKGKSVKVNGASMTTRERCLQYIIERFQTNTLQALGLVDCGLHEIGVNGLEGELKAIVDGLDPTPDIRIHRFGSYLFLHTGAVKIERIEWRPLFPADRLKKDKRRWFGEGKRDAEINNLVARRHWRGCLVVNLTMLECNMVQAEGGSYSGGLARRSGAAQPPERMRARFIFLHSVAGNKKVKLPCRNVANHEVPDNDRAILSESLATAICYAIEPDKDTKIDACAVLGDTNLDLKEAADNGNDVGDVDVDADDDDYVYFRMLCPAACNRK